MTKKTKALVSLLLCIIVFIMQGCASDVTAPNKGENSEPIKVENEYIMEMLHTTILLMVKKKKNQFTQDLLLQ